MLGFNAVSWYGALAGAAAIYLLWAAAIDTGHRHYRAIKQRIRPAAPDSPIVVLGQPGYSYSTVAVAERRLDKRAYLTKLDLIYLIENKDDEGRCS